MVTLFTRPGCAYCAKVLARVSELGIPFEEKSIADEKNLAELLERGGKRQVPYLVDDERGVSMYESDDIVAYLEERKT